MWQKFYFKKACIHTLKIFSVPQKVSVRHLSCIEFFFKFSFLSVIHDVLNNQGILKTL